MFKEFIWDEPRIFRERNLRKGFKNSRNETDFEEELSKDLEEAFKKYKKNFKKKDNAEKSNSISKRPEPINDTIKRPNKNKNLNTKVSQASEFDFLLNDVASLDLQKLTDFFFAKENKKEELQVKTNIDYEKQGAIPKTRMPKSSNKLDKSHSETKDKIKSSNLNQTYKDHEKNHRVTMNGQQRSKSNIYEAKVSEADLIHCNFATDLYTGNEILAINEEICKKPFFYIVPKNPLPNFFFSPGSYYITPKPPDSIIDDVVIFHPETKAPEKENLKKIVLSFNEKITKNKENKNNLDKETFQKSDSHLNIGPLDAKLNEFFRNLETNHSLHKVYKKDLLTSQIPKSPKKKNRESQVSVETVEDNFNEKNERRDPRIVTVSDVPGNDCGEFVWLFKDSASNYETEEKEEEISRNRNKLDNVIQRLMSEFSDFDINFASEIANKYLHDEPGLEEFIESQRLAVKKRQQLERMILTLPESSFEELEEKLEELEGDEQRIEDYIKEVQSAHKQRELLVELQLVFPDADPDFLLNKIKLWKDINFEVAVNKLTNELLDHVNYPKIAYESFNKEKEELWQLYVENFNIKSYILEVPDPSVFKRHTRNESNDLLINFLMSRYPDCSEIYLNDMLQSQNYNLTKTCDVLSYMFDSVKLQKKTFLSEDFDKKFLLEVVYVEHQKEIDEYLKSLAELKEIEVEEARINDAFLSCPLCSDTELIASEAFTCPDGHIFCKDCIKRYISVRLSEGLYEFPCPSEKCITFFSCTALQEIIPGTVLSRVTRKQQVEEINKAKVNGLESCPHCDFAYIPHPEEKIFKCQNPACLSETCRKCGEGNHIPLRCEEVEKSADVEARKKIEETMSIELIRSCPNCFKKFVKIDGCNKIQCSCGTLMCYICRKQIQDYDHFSRYSSENKCPLYSNNDVLHREEVFRAGVQVRDEILRENPNIKILYDPTK